MKFSTKVKIKSLIKNFGFTKNELCEVAKLYDGKPFDSTDNAYLKIKQISKRLCDEYTKLYYLVDSDHFKSKHNRQRVIAKKNKILKMLIPWKMNNVDIRNNPRIFIGLVEFEKGSFVNAYAKFPDNCLIKFGKYTTLAPRVTFKSKPKQKIIKPGLTIIKEKCWLGIGSIIYPDIVISDNAVVAAGAIVKNNIKSFCIGIGRKAFYTKESRSYDTNKHLQNSINYKNLINWVSVHFPYAKTEYVKAIKGEAFNAVDPGIIKLLSLTRLLCNKYNKLIKNNKHNHKKISQIIDLLFPFHGSNFKIGKNFNLDLLGSVIIGNNVTIGENVFLSGKIIISDNVKIGNNSILQAATHSSLWDERRIKKVKGKMLCEIYWDTIKINNNKKIGNNVIVVPKSIVNKNIPSNSLFVRDQIIQ